jgi:hypothetical protein
MKDLGGSKGIAPSFLPSALHVGEWSAFTRLLLFTRGNSPLYALYRRLRGPQSRSCPCRESNPVSRSLAIMRLGYTGLLEYVMWNLKNKFQLIYKIHYSLQISCDPNIIFSTLWEGHVADVFDKFQANLRWLFSPISSIHIMAIYYKPEAFKSCKWIIKYEPRICAFSVLDGAIF